MDDIRGRFQGLRGSSSSSSGGNSVRLPRVLTLAQRRRTGMVKQWSMDETKSWFYGRSSSLERQDRQPAAVPEESASDSSPREKSANGRKSSAAEKKRKFFQRKNTASAPTSSTESVEASG